MSRTVYVNGDYVDEADAKISVFDRGFLFADAAYEVCSVLQGKLIDNKAHLARMRRSLAEMQIELPTSDEEIVAVQKELLQRNNIEEGLVYMQVSRGAADREFHFPSDATASLVAFTQEKSLIESAYAKSGIAVVSMPDIRWRRRDIKTVGLLAQVFAKQAALDAGVQDAWMIEDGYVTEGSSNNAFIIDQSGDMITRQLGNEILPGITRASVLEYVNAENIKLHERPFTIEEAQAAREAFITSATTFVWPVVEIDGVKVGDGKPGPVAPRLREIYIKTTLARAEQ